MHPHQSHSQRRTPRSLTFDGSAIVVFDTLVHKWKIAFIIKEFRSPIVRRSDTDSIGIGDVIGPILVNTRGRHFIKNCLWSVHRIRGHPLGLYLPPVLVAGKEDYRLGIPRVDGLLSEFQQPGSVAIAISEIK